MRASRGAKIYAEVLGYGVSADASHVSDPDPTGANPARAMRMAFTDAGIDPEVDRLRERARDVDPVRRRGRDARPQARSRRGEGVPHARLLDEGSDRALPRRGGRGRGDLHHLRAAARRASADDQLRGAGSRSATSTTSRTRRVARTSRSASRTRSASAGTTPASCSAAGTRARSSTARSSRRSVSRQTPSSSRDPLAAADDAEAERSWSATLASFSGKMLVWIVQMPAASVRSAISASMSARPTPDPRAPPRRRRSSRRPA